MQFTSHFNAFTNRFSISRESPACFSPMEAAQIELVYERAGITNIFQIKEIALCVLSNCKVKGVPALALVSKSFSDICASDLFWKTLIPEGPFDARFSSLKEGFRHNGMEILKDMKKQISSPLAVKQLWRLLDRLMFNHIKSVKKMDQPYGYEIKLASPRVFATSTGQLEMSNRLFIMPEKDKLRFRTSETATTYPCFVTSNFFAVWKDCLREISVTDKGDFEMICRGFTKDFMCTVPRGISVIRENSETFIKSIQLLKK